MSEMAKSYLWGYRAIILPSVSLLHRHFYKSKMDVANLLHLKATDQDEAADLRDICSLLSDFTLR